METIKRLAGAKAVARLAERMGLADRETFKARARSTFTHYRGSPDV